MGKISRREWFKLLACQRHTEPQQSCDYCWAKVNNKLNMVCQQETGHDERIVWYREE